MGHPCQRWFNIEGGLSRGKDSAHVLEPYQKGETAPTQLSFCSFSPILRPRSSAPVHMPQRLFRILAFSGRPQRTILASASSCAPQRSLRALAFSARPGPVWHMAPSAPSRPFLRRLLYAPCSVRHAVPRTLFFSRRIFYMTSTVSWQLSGRSSKEIRRALSYP